MPHYTKHITVFNYQGPKQAGGLTYHLWTMFFLDGMSEQALFTNAHHAYINTIQDNAPELELEHIHIHIDGKEFNLITEILIPSSRYNVEIYKP